LSERIQNGELLQFGSFQLGGVDVSLNTAAHIGSVSSSTPLINPVAAVKRNAAALCGDVIAVT